MLMDKTTDFITHFIGIFHIAIEEERMRDVYEKFNALKNIDPDFGPLLNIKLNIHAPYKLKDFTPGLKYTPLDFQADQSLSQSDYPFWSPSKPISLDLNQSQLAPQFFLGPTVLLSFGGEFLLQLEPASSIVSVVYQTASLMDNDVISFSNESNFVAPEVYLSQLETMAELAELVNGVAVADIPSFEGSTQEYAIDLHTRISEASALDLEGLNVTLLHGADAYGDHENGESVTELSVLNDLMPQYLQPEEPDEDAPEDAGQLPSDPSLNMFDVDPGHNVVSGANLLVNEVIINMSWLDAPVISVMGDVVHLDAISQTNILVNHDNLASGATSAPSNVLNMASIAYTSSAPVTDEESDEAAEPDTSLPSNWVVARLEADVIAVNWIHQYTFATDTDRAEIEFSGTETYIGLGENTIINATNLYELGYGYDLIIIGGSMINVSMINQTNVLLDNDNISYGGMGPVGASGGDNLLANSAFLNGIGIDSYVEMEDAFANATESLADGALNISASVAQQSYFEGVEVLRVLYIEGDLTTLNLIEQTNILGDADQVHLALEDFQNTNGGDFTVTAGSNALLNIASVTEYGTDSTVLVGGEVYSDALLYQAELIDTDANPLGVGMNDLTSEAVAFLAEDMIEPDQPDLLGPPPTIDDGSTSPDVMQTMLA